MTKHYLLGEVATILGCRPHQIDYLLKSRQVPEPERRIANKRLFTERDVLRVARRLKVEDLQSQSYAQVANGNDTATIGGITYSRAWTVTPNSPAANLKTVTLTVTWGDRQGNHTLSNQTIRGQ